jgi:hypothetical protein
VAEAFNLNRRRCGMVSPFSTPMEKERRPSWVFALTERVDSTLKLSTLQVFNKPDVPSGLSILPFDQEQPDHLVCREKV